MEPKREIAKLVNVLRRTARMALQSEWTGGGQDTAAFCVQQYNRVLARLRELDPNLSAIFQPLLESSSLTVVAVACRQLVAYYEEEFGPFWGWGRAYCTSIDPDALKEFWYKAARDIEDLGEFIREGIEEWTRRRKQRSREEKG
jgi:hypothetical protein